MSSRERRASVSLGARGWLRRLPLALLGAALLAAAGLGWRALARKIPPGPPAASVQASAPSAAAPSAAPSPAAADGGAERAAPSPAGGSDAQPDDRGVVELLDVLEALGDVPEGRSG